MGAVVLDIENKEGVQINNFLNSRIHKSFTEAADQLCGLGFMSLPERIELSSIIGDALKLFTELMQDKIPNIADIAIPRDIAMDIIKTALKNPLPVDEESFFKLLVAISGKCAICHKFSNHLQKHRKKRGYEGGEYTAKNIQLLCPKCHKKVHHDAGEYEMGGEWKHKKLRKELGEEGYSQWQAERGKEKQQKVRDELGEEGYSKKQRDIANQRWHPKKKKKKASLPDTEEEFFTILASENDENVIDEEDNFRFDPNSTENEARYRLIDPKVFDQDTIRRWKIWKDVRTPGVRFVVGVDTRDKEWKPQAIRFDKSVFDEEKANEWWEENKDKFTKEWYQKDWDVWMQKHPKDISPDYKIAATQEDIDNYFQKNIPLLETIIEEPMEFLPTTYDIVQCAWCKKYMDHNTQEYVEKPTKFEVVSHGICPKCIEEYFEKSTPKEANKTIIIDINAILTKSAGKFDKLIKDAKKALFSLTSEGFSIILLSNRYEPTQLIEELTLLNIPFDSIQTKQNQRVSYKEIQFKGDWDSVIAEVKSRNISPIKITSQFFYVPDKGILIDQVNPFWATTNGPPDYPDPAYWGTPDSLIKKRRKKQLKKTEENET
jgi:5-methylcytosine-specific restriction endonuclease McrA